MSLIFASGMPVRISFSTSSDVYEVPNTRWGPTFWLKRVAFGSDAGEVTSGFFLSAARAGICGSTRRKVRRRPSGLARPLTAARRSSSASLGTGSGSHDQPSAGGGGAPSGSWVWIAVRISAPATASIAAWCTRRNVAIASRGTWSMPSRPSMRYSSHGGRLRSSGRAWMRAICVQNCRQLPGRGKAMWRTWYSRSNPPSRIHHGRSRPNGTSTIRSRKLSATWRRASMYSSTSSSVGGPPGREEVS